MIKSRTILVIIGTYLPGNKAGGPIHSIANLVESLGDEFKFKIITADHDFGMAEPYVGITSDTWSKVGKADVFYASKKNFSLRALAKLINSTDHDVLYLNSFFCLDYTIKPLLLRYLKLIPNGITILAPRGMFSIGALKLKWFKKWVYILIVRVLGLYNNIIWQASSKFEEMDIRNVFGDVKIKMGSPIVVAPDLVSFKMDNIQQDIRTKKQGSLHIVFLSRISPKKNLDGALTMLKDVRGDITFNIYGPAEDHKYLEKCREISDDLNTNIKVVFHGEINHERVQEVFSANHLFFFPTLGENFGHVILEAFLMGCPVLLSNQTPWRNLENLGIGRDIPLDRPDKFKEVLKHYVEMDNLEFERTSKKAADFGKSQLNDTTILQQNRELFLSGKQILQNNR